MRESSIWHPVAEQRGASHGRRPAGRRGGYRTGNRLGSGPRDGGGQSPVYQQKLEELLERLVEPSNNPQSYQQALQDFNEFRLGEHLSSWSSDFSGVATTIDVEIENGVATLTGRVASELAKQHALRIALSARYVTSVRDNISGDASMQARSAGNY